MKSNREAYIVGIYLRISKEDGDNIESESITNQRKIIKDYISKNQNTKFYREYIDDGFSGANFNRPGFQKLLKDIEGNKVNMVITKNLARLGRNYIETGNYIEKYFPNHNVRYISLLDNIDNYKDSVSNDYIPIKSVFNEKHCKDTSISIKKTKREKMMEGFYACNTAPFGYRKDPDNPGKLIVDEKSSKTVKKIFDLKLRGYTTNEIVQYLDKNNYTTPAEYMKIRGQEYIKNKNIWRRSTVTRILCNKVYLGYCVRGKTQKNNYKSKNRIFIKRNDFIITKNTHEPIVSEEVFEKVHDVKKYGKEKKYSKTNYLLKNLIFCKNCGKRLIFKKARNKVIIYCGNYEENIELCQNDCRLDYFTIENKILNYISNMYKEYLKKDLVKSQLYKRYNEISINVLNENLNKLYISLDKLNSKITYLYNQRLLEKINEIDYRSLYILFSNQRKKILDSIINNEKEIKNEKNDLDIKEIDVFDKRLCIEKFVEKIEIYKKEIDVKFNFKI